MKAVVPPLNEKKEESPSLSPFNIPHSDVVKENDHVLLLFNNGYQIFAHVVKKWKGKTPPVKINKRTYCTSNLIGLPYGIVLELGPKSLVPLPLGSDIDPEPLSKSNLLSGINSNLSTNKNSMEANKDSNPKEGTENAKMDRISNDNRNLLDNNTSQSITQPELHEMQKKGTHGSQIVAALISNSSSFHTKTQFSQDKYIRKKQQKYQLRCRMVRPTASNICQAYFLKDARRIMNLREDTLAQILSYSNVYAGCQVLVMEKCMGILTGALAQRIGGYGRILSVYTGMAPAYLDLISKYNLSFSENQSIKWMHSGEIFGDGVKCENIKYENKINDKDDKASTEFSERTESCTPNINSQEGTNLTKIDWEAHDREKLKWPCPLQPHTHNYLTKMSTDKERNVFLTNRANRFARKLTRPTTMENRAFLHKQSDSLIIATHYDPKTTLFQMLPFLAPSCPFVVLCEYIEPLVDCFNEIQKQKLAINLRLSDTWMREFQVLPGRTHPNMNMGQHGGFILTGMKVCPIYGINELDEELEKQIREQIGGRRGKKKNKEKAKKRKEEIDDDEDKQNERKRRKT